MKARDLVAAILALFLSFSAVAESVPESVTAQVLQRHGEEKSGFLLLEGNREAMDWRLALIDSAERSIDVQYFIWKNDPSAGLLMERILLATERGVRVRMLVDDLALTPDSHELAALSRHPLLAIKIFNPTESRGGFVMPLLEWAMNFGELNRRMHNKLLLVDDAMAIIGGRNIGNEYFGLSPAYNFRDLDLLVAGAVIPQLEAAFEEYWLSEPAVAAGDLASETTDDDLAAELAKLDGIFAEDHVALAATPFALEPKDWSEAFEGLGDKLAIGEASMIQDEPVLHQGEQRRLTDSLDYLTDDLKSELILATPYLIPVGSLLEDLGTLVAEGAYVSVLTGSLGSNNHTVAHAHYKKYRKPILEQGMSLFEFRHDPSPAKRALSDTPPVRSDFVAIHVKALVADRRRIFLGSLNLDPRAIVLNTENGLLIDSPELGRQLGELFDRMRAPDSAWEVTLDGQGNLRWTSSEGVVTRQPGRSGGQRVQDFLYGLLPIESQL